jgi:putative ABC transport system permease protein
MRHKTLGFSREHVILIPVYSRDALLGIETLKNELRRNPSVLGVSATNFSPGRKRGFQNYWYEGVSEDAYHLMMHWYSVDQDFLDTFRIELKEGRNFSPEFPTDRGEAYILNESAAKAIGYPSPLGKPFGLWVKGRIIGVVKDFHFMSLHRQIEPLALYIHPESFRSLAVRLHPKDMPTALASLQRTWKRLVPDQMFSFTFVDENYESLYGSERRLSRIFSAASFLAVLIACLGLFGLAALSTELRTKEIGIRKVLGASGTGLVVMLSREYVQMVLLANIIAWPAAWFIMRHWLQDFAYRIPLAFWFFLLSGSLLSTAALLTVGLQVLKKSCMNPARTLRYE